MACSSWSGKTRDVSDTAERAYAYCDELKLEGFTYDADGGYGTGVRSETNRIAERRKLQRRPVLRVTAFRGSGAVFGPDRKVPGTDVVAKERFQNAKAQGWHSLSERARNTHNGVNGMPYDKDNLLSISSGIPELNKMMVELSQPQWKFSASGKLLVDKVPDGAASPNLADAVMMLFAPRRGPLLVTDAVLREMQRGNYQNF